MAMKKKLTITIATIPKRQRLFDSLMNELSRQISTFGYEKEIEILFDADDDRFLGTKRKLMLEKAQGLFTCAIDDDDEISESYLYHLINAINQDESVDCLAINGYITTNGEDERKWFISCHYEDWFEKDNIYYRTPNHICPIRTDIARLVNFDDVDWGEDYLFSKNIKQFLKTETQVVEPIYWYRYSTQESLVNYQKQKKKVMDIIEKFKEITKGVSNPIVIELGGCDGYHTNIMCKALSETHSSFIYHVLEPVESLSKSISRVTEWCKNVEVSTMAVSAKTGQMTFYKSDNKYYGSSSIRKPKRAFEFWQDMSFQECTCEAITLDDFVKLKNIEGKVIDWIWADVQGAEKDLIEGSENTMKNVRYFYTEFMEYEVYEGQIFDFDSLCKMLPDFEVVHRFEHDVLFKNKNL